TRSTTRSAAQVCSASEAPKRQSTRVWVRSVRITSDDSQTANKELRSSSLCGSNTMPVLFDMTYFQAFAGMCLDLVSSPSSEKLGRNTIETTLAPNSANNLPA